MPKRKDLKKILVIGSGPIQIGQACEFDYSGTQAIKALRELGYQIVLVNSNPATIMTDPHLADRTYIEPLSVDFLERIIQQERPDALLPTLGGQVALNLAMELHRHGVLETYKVEVLGARIHSIDVAEDREKFRQLMLKLELPVLRSVVVRSMNEGLNAVDDLGYPLVLRPSFTLGGTGGGIVYNRAEFTEKLEGALRASPTSEVLLEESIIGWKEIELEVMRDRKGQFVMICGIENCDPMGIHTGDSITCAPIQTLTDKEVQRLRDAARMIIEGVGVETGGCNIQFACDPKSSRYVVIEMNPRVSRSSALASKATGFPIAKLAALLSVGLTLDEVQNDITKKTPASFEPALDYVVVKIPRFAFEKFQMTDPLLGTQMKSVGEVLSYGRSFPEALMKAFQSLELGTQGLFLPERWKKTEIDLASIRAPRFDRWWLIAELLRREKASLSEIAEATGIDPWFLSELGRIIEMEKKIAEAKELSSDLIQEAKALGFGDRLIERCRSIHSKPQRKIKNLSEIRRRMGIRPFVNQVDTCAGEFEAVTPYYYLAYERFSNAPAKVETANARIAAKLKTATQKSKTVVVLGSGPNRIGQGVEFDYCCVKAVQAAKELGFETVMINCNPETVSTDYDLADRLYFEPLEKEFVEEVLRNEGQIHGLICQTGGQTALKLSQALKDYPLLGTSADQIDRAEDRARFDALLQKLKLKRPQSGFARKVEDLPKVAKKLGYPVLIRPSYVLGGRSMHIVRGPEGLDAVIQNVLKSEDVSFPLLVDRFLENAVEVDVDCIGDGREMMVCAVMEHIEEAGIHSGDSSCALPAMTLSDANIQKLEVLSKKIARELKLKGFLNIQFAIYDGEIFVLEVNPRASRTLPFVCKATGVDWVRAGVFAMLGKSFREQKLKAPPLLPKDFKSWAVKEVVFPFLKFPNEDVLLGPEMKSTGEVMGIGKDFSEAFVKGLIASGHRLPKTGTVFVSVRDEDKSQVVDICRKLKGLGFRLLATHGTAAFLRERGIVVSGINKVKEGQPHIVDAIINGQVQLVINTTGGYSSISDSFSIRRSALQMGVPYFTTLTAASAAVGSMSKFISGDLGVASLQDLHAV